MMLSWKMAACLAAGNTVVIKPAQVSPLTALKFAELSARAGIPPGVINVLPGTGRFFIVVSSQSLFTMFTNTQSSAFFLCQPVPKIFVSTVSVKEIFNLVPHSMGWVKYIQLWSLLTGIVMSSVLKRVKSSTLLHCFIIFHCAN